jgi:hypothetical protein
MPGIGGLELQERIRGTARRPDRLHHRARRPGRAPAGARTGSGRSAQEGAPSWRRCRRGRASSRHGSGRSSPSSRRGTPTSAWEPTIGAAEATIKLHRARHAEDEGGVAGRPRADGGQARRARPARAPLGQPAIAHCYRVGVPSPALVSERPASSSNPSSFQPVIPPIIFLTGRCRRATRTAARSAPLQWGPEQ